jgi:hypothetical protein
VASATWSDETAPGAQPDAPAAPVDPPPPKPGLEPPFLRGLCYGLAASTAIWSIVAAALILLH